MSELQDKITVLVDAATSIRNGRIIHDDTTRNAVLEAIDDALVELRNELNEYDFEEKLRQKLTPEQLEGYYLLQRREQGRWYCDPVNMDVKSDIIELMHLDDPRFGTLLGKWQEEDGYEPFEMIEGIAQFLTQSPEIQQQALSTFEYAEEDDFDGVDGETF